jgi:hypothetical protein
MEWKTEFTIFYLFRGNLPYGYGIILWKTGKYSFFYNFLIYNHPITLSED